MINEKVFKIISQVMKVPVEEINEQSSPENLAAWDSFQHMNLILALEEEFNIRFTDEEIVQVGDAGLILQTLQNKGVPA